MLEKAIERYLSNTFEKKGSKKEKGRIFSLFSLDRCDVIAVPVYSGFQMTVEYSLPESIFLPTAAGANCVMNQPGFPAITCHLLKARKITRKRCDWIWFSSSLVEKLTRNFLADHSIRNRVLTFDSFENCCIWKKNHLIKYIWTTLFFFTCQRWFGVYWSVHCPGYRNYEPRGEQNINSWRVWVVEKSQAWPTRNCFFSRSLQLHLPGKMFLIDWLMVPSHEQQPNGSS